MKKRYLLASSMVACLVIAMIGMTMAQPSPGNQLPYNIKIISTQEVGNDLWTCYEVYDDLELLFYDCVITDKKLQPENIKIILEAETKVIYDRKNQPIIPNKNVDKNIKCWEYSKKLGDWMWIC